MSARFACRLSFLPALGLLTASMALSSARDARAETDYVLPDTLAVQVGQYPDLKRVTAVYGHRAFSHNRRVTSIVFGPEDRTIVTASGDDIRQWSFPEGKLQRTLHIDSLNESDLSISEARDRLVIASDKGEVQVLSWPDGKKLCDFFTLDQQRSKIRYVHDVAISPDGTYLAIGIRRGTWTNPRGERNARVSEGGVMLYTLDDQELIYELDEVGGAGIALAWNPGSDTLCVARFDGKLQLVRPRDVSATRVIEIPMLNETESPVAVTFSPDGSRLAMLTSHLKIGVWDVGTRKQVWLDTKSMRRGKLVWHGSPGELVWDARRNRLIAGTWLDSAQLVFNAATGERIRHPDANVSWGQAIAGSDTADIIVATREQVVERLNPETLQPMGKRQRFDLAGGTTHVAASSDGRHFVTSGDRSVFVWDIDHDEPIGRIDASGKTRLSSDGSTIVVANQGNQNRKGRIRLFDLSTRKLIREWMLPDRLCDDLRVTPDGRRLVVCGRHQVWLYAIEDGTLIRTIVPEQNEIKGKPADWLNGVTVSQDSRYIAVCVGLRHPMSGRPLNETSRRTIQIYDLKTGKQISTIVCPGDASGYEFSSTGDYLVATATEAVSIFGTLAFPSAMMFDVESGLEVGRLVSKSMMRGARFLSVDRTGQRFFTTSGGRILVWGMADEVPIADWEFPGAFRQPAIFPDGDFIIAPHSDGTLWRIRLETP